MFKSVQKKSALLVTITGISELEMNFLQFKVKQKFTNNEYTDLDNQNSSINSIKKIISTEKNLKDSTDSKNSSFKNEIFTISNTLTARTTFIACHSPSLSDKYINSMIYNIPAINIQGIYFLLEMTQEKHFTKQEIYNFLLKFKMKPLESLHFFVLQCGVMNKNVINYLELLGGIHSETLKIGIDFMIYNEKFDENNDNIDQSSMHEKIKSFEKYVFETKCFATKNNILCIPLEKVFLNDWSLFRRNGILFRRNELPTKCSISDNIEQKSPISDIESKNSNSLVFYSNIFQNKIFFISPSFNSILQSFLIKLIIQNGGIRTNKQNKNVDFCINEFISDDIIIHENKFITVTPNYIFYCVTYNSLLCPLNFLYARKKITQPLKNATFLFNKNVFNQNYKLDNHDITEERYLNFNSSLNNIIQNKENIIPENSFSKKLLKRKEKNKLIQFKNKLQAMGGIVKSHFDQTVTHIISNIHSGEQIKNIQYISLFWIDKCLNTLKLPLEKKFLQIEKKDFNYRIIKYDEPIIWIGGVGKNIRRNICDEMKKMGIKIFKCNKKEDNIGKSEIDSLDRISHLITGSLDLSEKLIIAILKGINVLKISNFYFKDSFIEDKNNTNLPIQTSKLRENDQDILLINKFIHKKLDSFKYTHADVHDKHRKVIDALIFWKNFRAKKGGAFSGWRVWIKFNLILVNNRNMNNSAQNTTTFDLNETTQIDQKEEKRLLSLINILKAGNAEIILIEKYCNSDDDEQSKKKNFSYTHILKGKNVNGKGVFYNWIFTYLFSCGKC